VLLVIWEVADAGDATGDAGLRRRAVGLGVKRAEPVGLEERGLLGRGLLGRVFCVAVLVVDCIDAWDGCWRKCELLPCLGYAAS
jgi:hypothetical protein